MILMDGTVRILMWHRAKARHEPLDGRVEAGGSSVARRLRSCSGCHSTQRRRGAARAGELEEIVDGADDRPLRLGIGETAQKQLAESTSLLDLTEDGLDHLLAQAVAAASGAALEPCRHGGDAGAATLCPSACGGCRAVLVPAGGDVALDAALVAAGEVVLRVV